MNFIGILLGIVKGSHRNFRRKCHRNFKASHRKFQMIVLRNPNEFSYEFSYEFSQESIGILLGIHRIPIVIFMNFHRKPQECS